jgi:hypothetical protein
MKLVAILALLSASIWESKPPADWTEGELMNLLTDSPWAQMAGAPADAASHGEGIQVYLATAAPMLLAEAESKRRHERKANGPAREEDPLAAEARLWMEDNRATQIVVAIRIARNKAFDDAADTKRMEEESIMRVGRKKYKMSGNFPPIPADPYLRIAFPRAVTESDKSVVFELYVPGARPPYRTVEFRVKDMMWKGKLEL